MTDKKAQLTIDGVADAIDLPIYSPTVGPDVIDVTSITSKGYFTYDPGFMSTGACESKITFIDGGKGVLLHRGYPIGQLASQSTHLETSYLLLNGELPSASQKETFVKNVTAEIDLDESIVNIIKSFKTSAHPMSVLCSSTAALSSIYNDDLDITNADHRLDMAYKLLGKMPTLASYTYRHLQGQELIAPDASLSYSENFLNMMFGAEKVTPTLSKAIDRLFILHADHEQNASTSTVRLAGSSGTNPFVAISAGIATLWGPSHGGANEAVLQMLEEIGSVDNIDAFVAKAKDKADPFRLMGFGHRVYKNFDPRAKVMAESCDEVLKELGLENDPLLAIAKRLEAIALEDEYFIQKKLYPNVDFYSGIIMKAMGIPTELFTVMFATGRAIGWYAHWNEMLSAPFKIGRPRQLYTGYTQRDYTPTEER
tara:strand:- start:4779 stop:6056 length:1278 start_codon:yes stop_codon:yes gene_type:complete